MCWFSTQVAAMAESRSVLWVPHTWGCSSVIPVYEQDWNQK